MKKSLILAFTLAFPAIAYAGDATKTVTVKGSDTMVVLGQRWAEEYMKSHPAMQIQVTGGGSGTGISALINGTTDICQSSRPMKDAEKDKAKEKYGTQPFELAVAKDGLSIYVHASNKIESVTIDQLKQIFTGKVTNWKDLGGSDSKITIYSRENSSGTYAYFKEEVLGGADFAAQAQTLPGTAAVVNAVGKEKNGIGYGGAAYAKGIKVLKVAKANGEAPIGPDAENVHSGKYPLSRSLFFYFPKEPQGDMKAFTDWVLSKQGQSLAEQVGYFPVK